MRHHRKLTDDERHQIIEHRAEGTSATTLNRRFGVSPRAIYNTLSKTDGWHAAQTRTVSTRVSERELTLFMAALAVRSFSNRPAALRCLLGAADKILTPAN